jgi:hypothetical protein
MASVAESNNTKIIVVPRALEGFFLQRLRELYSSRPEVKIVVDKRVGDRRTGDRYICHASELSNRRESDRRESVGEWSLPKMPFAAS